MSSSGNNEKVIYQIWTDGKGNFAVRKKEKEYKEKDSQFEYSDSQEQEKYSKLIDSKMCYDGSITKELVQDWIVELKEEDVLDQDGNLIYF
ncbi:MAG TPA: hypothetical protein VMS35_03675 [Nitrososphaeraceae archaeon]|nr:hypothetical protein [Nitrososphaeraceae archaeon]